MYHKTIFGNLHINKNAKINPYLLSSMIEVVVEEFNYGSITAEVFRAIIIDLCIFYGETIFSNTENKIYSEELLTYLSDEAAQYLAICLDEFKISVNHDNLLRGPMTLYVENIEGIDQHIIASIITEITDKFKFKAITAHDFKETMIDICCNYGYLIFDRLENKHFSKLMIELLSEEVPSYIELCIAKYQLKAMDDYDEPNLSDSNLIAYY